MRTETPAQLRRSEIAETRRERPLTDRFKQLAREQWGSNPCGAHVARELEFGTREYFDAIEHNRYQIESPWMKSSIGFDNFSGKRLLEIGIGTGTDLLQFARGGAIVTGIDITPRSIEISRRRFQVYGLSGEFALGDAENLSFPSASYDVVYSFGVLHHTPDTTRAVGEIHRVLKPGGKAIVMLYHRRSLYYWGSLIMKHGILRAELLHKNVADIMSSHVEFSATEGRPLVKAYTQPEIRHMFRIFSACETSVNQLTREQLRPFGRFLPETLLQWLARNFGWNVLITATK